MVHTAARSSCPPETPIESSLTASDPTRFDGGVARGPTGAVGSRGRKRNGQRAPARGDRLTSPNRGKVRVASGRGGRYPGSLKCHDPRAWGLGACVGRGHG